MTDGFTPKPPGRLRGHPFKKGPVRRSGLSLQPIGEVLLQIRCRCSNMKQSAQFMIAERRADV